MAGLLSLPSSSSDRQAISQAQPQNEPASKQFAAWLEVFNSHDRDNLLTYHNACFSYDIASPDVGNIDNEMALSKITGGFDIVDVLNSLDADTNCFSPSVNVILREKSRAHYARAMMQVDARRDDNPVTKFEISPTITPIKFVPNDRKREYERALQKLTPSLRCTIVRKVSGVIREQYIFPGTGEQMTQDLKIKAQDDGEYASYEDSELFSRRLTKDLQAASKDMHIRIIFREPPLPPNNDGGHDSKEPPMLFDALRTMNFGFGNTSVEIIKNKKIGLLRINSFVPSSPPYASDYAGIRKAISDILSEVADADALLIDLRTNGGGHPDTVAFVLSYFLDNGPVHLNDMVDRNGTIKYSFSTLPASELPKGAVRFGGSKPLFILTSKRTISGGEDMAYDLQMLKRANAIIGEDETTAGAANPVMSPKFICEEEFGKGWWFVGVPDLRPVNEVTGGNWEGIGVQSDVIVREEERDAEDVGKKMALEALGLEDGS